MDNISYWVLSAILFWHAYVASRCRQEAKEYFHMMSIRLFDIEKDIKSLTEKRKEDV